MKNLSAIILSATLILCAAGCGGGPCDLSSITVSPQNATADHAAAPPGNQVQFSPSTMPTSCLPDVPLFFVSDPNVTIGSGKVLNEGLATCLGATSGPVTVTATSFGPGGKLVKGTATLTCK